jgi:sulfatase maturation enzyme AslB (radical SAM superfamily)
MKFVGMDNIYPSFNCNVARLINREESYTVFVPHIPEIIRVSKKLFDALRLCTGEYSFSNIAEQVAISDKSSTFDAFKEFDRRGILRFKNSPVKSSIKHIEITSAPKMRCRTAIYHITLKCNLSCQHCYASSSPNVEDARELSTLESSRFIRNFANSSGLFIDFTGGEALLREDIYDQLSLARSLGLRVSLLSNGKLITPKTTERLKSSVHEVTISIDGSKDTHDKIRGEGAYDKESYRGWDRYSCDNINNRQVILCIR